MALVETHVAMAFGASVQPLTRITPSVKTVDTISIGLWHICSQNSGNPIVIPRLSVLNFGTVIAQGDTIEALNNPQVVEAYIGK